jgi:hypothetical protein
MLFLGNLFLFAAELVLEGSASKLYERLYPFTCPVPLPPPAEVTIIY